MTGLGAAWVRVKVDSPQTNGVTPYLQVEKIKDFLDTSKSYFQQIKIAKALVSTVPVLYIHWWS